MDLNHLKNKKVLITGHTGFVGSWLAMVLHVNKINVYGISLKPHFDNKIYKFMKKKKFFFKKEFIFDMCEYNILKKRINKIKPDYIFHFAAQSSVSRGYERPMETYKNNFLSSINLLETLRDINFRTHLIFSTTDKVYSSDYLTPFNENSPLGGSDPYSNSKDFSDNLVKNYYKNFLKNKKLAINIFRAGNIIGGGDRNKDRLISDILHSLENKKNIYLRAPNYVRPWQHILDICNALLILSRSITGKKILTIYNLGIKKRKNMTVKELTNLFYKNYCANNLKLSKKVKIKIKKNKITETKKLILNTSKFHSKFKNIYKLSQKESVEWTSSWFLREKNGISNYTNTKEQIDRYAKKS
jgi:CDP-glucose 4,6-dehydratase